MRRVLTIILLSLLLSHPVISQKRAITVEDLWSLRRVNSFALSPDGQWIAYTLIQYNMEKNIRKTDIYLVNSKGGLARQLTTHPANDEKPHWSPDGSLLSFISNRDGLPQIYTISMEGGEAQKISDIPTGVDDFIWSPDGKYYAFTSTLYPEMTDLDSSAARDRQQSESQVQARVIDHLFYRHWNRWLEDKRSHLFVMPSTGNRYWDITPGNFDTPPISLGSNYDFTFSPDSKEIAFVRNIDPVTAISTNNDIFIAPVEGGTIHRLTRNLANDNYPVYSPDGQYIAYRAMRRPGFESDQYDLMLYDRETGNIQNLTEQFDLDIQEIIWDPSSDKIYFTSGDQGRIVIFSVEIKNDKIKSVFLSGSNTNIRIDPEGNTLYFVQSRINLPHDIYRCDKNGEDRFQLTFINQDLLSQLQMNNLNDFRYPSFDNKIVHGFTVNPPFFNPAERYPAILLIHGGPQGAWLDEFHYRWNAQMFASRGYVVIMINIRGSKGYGQEFCFAVSEDWGGTPYRDLMSGLDYVLKKYPYIQPEHIAAAGASYGGYMINWIAGQTDRFKALVSHSGVSNLVSMYGSTEELWFPEWEFDGSPYENSKLYEKWSPLQYAKNFTTPTLVIHGQQDFRVPVEQGLQMFTALQRQNVPSELLYFPDEGHFINKPQNAHLWWNTVLGWIDQWTK